jgi:hypothetical protein
LGVVSVERLYGNGRCRCDEVALVHLAVGVVQVTFVFYNKREISWSVELLSASQEGTS